MFLNNFCEIINAYYFWIDTSDNGVCTHLHIYILFYFKTIIWVQFIIIVSINSDKPDM